MIIKTWFHIHQNALLVSKISIGCITDNLQTIATNTTYIKEIMSSFYPSIVYYHQYNDSLLARHIRT